MKKLVFFVALTMLCGCHTFMKMKPDYADMPADSIRAVAAEIEAAIQEGNREPQIADRDGVVVNTDAVKQAIRTRAIRYELIKAFLETGHAAEMNNGLVNVIRSREYKKFGTSRDRNRTALLIVSENGDRWAIYEGILKASNFRGKSLNAIQDVFYQERVKLLPSGLKYQDESGKIVAKD
ncbi:MAG: hypothetical protein K1Y02_12110 [Candidatus Hydrogenedentes bacterium]|nr:hypothetical protein [Candidatus Hydrogenedentota bacterium]